MKKILLLIILVSSWLPQLFAQGRSVSGKVTDSNGEAVVGANIVEKGTDNHAITDSRGMFTITISRSNSLLRISCIGFTTREVTAGKTANLQVVLNSDRTSLGEVVVVGYGTQKKASVVGAISQVKATELQQSSTPNLSNSI